MTIASWDDACLHNFTVANASNCTNPHAPGPESSVCLLLQVFVYC